jgi:ABC-type phosphate transport system permease subunit
MILPTVASVTIEVLKTVPLSPKEGALALGAFQGFFRFRILGEP